MQLTLFCWCRRIKTGAELGFFFQFVWFSWGVVIHGEDIPAISARPIFFFLFAIDKIL